MKIEFRKISKDPKDFSLKKDGLEFYGSFKKNSRGLVEISLNMKGNLEHNCDLCADEFTLEIAQKADILVCDGVYKGNELDVYESFDHYVDFDKIIQSEIEAFKSDYHYCKNCIENFKE